jgi:hypothetical protein
MRVTMAKTDALDAEMFQARVVARPSSAIAVFVTALDPAAAMRDACNRTAEQQLLHGMTSTMPWTIDPL